MKTFVLIIFMVTIATYSQQDNINIQSQDIPFDYFGIVSQGEKIELFAPGIVSLKNSNDFSLAVSHNSDEVFFTGKENWPKCKIMHVRKIDNNGRSRK